MWKKFAVLAALLAGLPAHGQINAPSDWRAESFVFPLPFAPAIPYEGQEQVRFAPYWSEFATERGFTYAVLWDIKTQPVTPQIVEGALKMYFDGLMEQVTKVQSLKDPGTVTSLSMHPMATPEGWREGYGGRLFTWNGFSKGEPLTLNMEVAHRPCGGGRTQLFFAYSQAPRSHTAWDALRDIRKATRCATPP